MRERLLRRMEEAGEPPARIEPARELPAGQLKVLESECSE